MKFFEFGKINDRTLLIFNGYLGKWEPGLMPFIIEAAKKYHVVVDAYDGFNPDEPQTVFHSIAEEARMAADYIVGNFDGKIDVVYGISLGGMVANELIADGRVKVHTLIADGYTIMPMPDFKLKCLNELYVRLYSAIIYSVLTKHQTLMARMLGRTSESLKESLYTDVSIESLRNSVAAEIGYKYKSQTFNQTDSYIFHGGAERAAARKVEKLRSKGIRFTHRIFPEVGHAGLAHGDPQKLIRLIDTAYERRLK